MKYILIILLSANTIFLFAQKAAFARQQIDSMVRVNTKLSAYKDLSYCKKIDFVDSLAHNDKSAFGNWYFKIAVIDITTKAGVDPKMDYESIAYFKREDYFKMSEECRKKLKCKKQKKK